MPFGGDAFCQRGAHDQVRGAVERHGFVGHGNWGHRYSATDIINGGWGADANSTNEGGNTCPTANISYSSALDAAVMTTDGSAIKSGGTNCAHIRSQYTVPASGDVVEAKIWRPSLSSAQAFDGSSYPAGTLIDWASILSHKPPT